MCGSSVQVFAREGGNECGGTQAQGQAEPMRIQVGGKQKAASNTASNTARNTNHTIQPMQTDSHQLPSPAATAAGGGSARAILSVRGVWRSFPSGDGTVDVLRDVNMDVRAGEFIAIVGASGSGKSTLMNILGCLDRPSRGDYLVQGENTAAMSPNALARLRREMFGFIFQRYHLLAGNSAAENAAIPAIYAGVPAAQQRRRAQQLLSRLGLGDKLRNKPGQLSGGQQQRVSIARALMNGGDVILADEPTGALDSRSGAEVLRILQTLNAEGHTIIMVTHDMTVARAARRIVEIKDGEIVRDGAHTPETEAARDTGAETRRQESAQCQSERQSRYSKPPQTSQHPQNHQNHQNQQKDNLLTSISGWFDRLREAAKMAVRATIAHRMRSFLTMLGIIIGIASVVSVVALGKGSQQKILSSMGNIGSNMAMVYPGDFGERQTGALPRLTMGDVEAVAALPFVQSASPQVSQSVNLRYRNVSLRGSVKGVGADYFRLKGQRVLHGAGFGQQAIVRLLPALVVDTRTHAKLFPSPQQCDAPQCLGAMVLLNNVPTRLVGVVETREEMGSEGLEVWLPYTTVMGRMLGKMQVSSIAVRLKDQFLPDSTRNPDGVTGKQAEQRLLQLLSSRHQGNKAFTIFSSDAIRQSVEKVTNILTLFISMIALISLVVGGIGVMNIMLVSVTERTQEIGVRMAVGARQGDIMQQFLIESILLCLLGGALGLALAMGVGWLFGQFVQSFSLVYSTTSIVGAFLVSSIIGILFGFLPARRAARLDPVVALNGD